MRKVNWGVIGAAGIADRRTIPGMILAGNAQLVAVMDVSIDLAERIRAKYNAHRAYSSATELLADPAVEAVYIASPVVYHMEHAILAARSRKHLLLEKPVALTVAQGYDVLDEIRKADVLAAAGFMMRFGAYNMKIRELIQAGVLGQIVSAKAQFTCWYPDMPGSWRQSWAQGGGGALMDMGVHCIDLIQYITGAKATQVAALTDTKTFQYEVDDSASVLFSLSNGANAFVEANFNIPDEAARWRLEFYGTKGSLVAHNTINQLDTGTIELVLSSSSMAYDAAQNKVDSKSQAPTVQFGNLYTREIESFSNSMLYGLPVEVPLSDAVQVQSVVEAAYMSSREKRFVLLGDNV